MSDKPIEPGCRAIITGCLVNPANIGTIVHVVDRVPRERFIRDGAKWVAADEPRWWVESLGHPLLTSLRRLAPAVPYRERFLRRLPDEDEVNKHDAEQEGLVWLDLEFIG
jgi:hypothetical protein